MKSDEMPYITYVDIESLIKKTDRCANNPEYSLWIFNGNNESKHILYRGKDCMKCESLKEHKKNIIDFEKKKMLPLTK